MRPARLALLICIFVAVIAVPLVVWALTKAQCTSTYQSCCATCRSMPDPRLRAACWPACMTAYAACLAIAK